MSRRRKRKRGEEEDPSEKICREGLENNS